MTNTKQVEMDASQAIVSHVKTDIRSCYIGPEISPEQFVPEHFFLYIAQGAIHGYDGEKKYTLRAGEYCLVRKNQLTRYNKQKENGAFEKVVIIFDEVFLKSFQEKHQYTAGKISPQEAFLRLRRNERVPNFVRSLAPYYTGAGKIDPAVADAKREELLLILLQLQPSLAGVLFDFAQPQKLNLEAFMNRNFKFNVHIGRFAYLTGRSLSAFKRDFREVFHDTPSRWLVRKRLQEAHFLIEKKNKKPSDIYLELGFEDLSHFSYAFKKHFHYAPSEVGKR